MYIIAPGDRRPEGNSQCTSSVVFFAGRKAKVGALSLPKSRPCHVRVMNQNYYGVLCNGTVQERSRGRDAFDSACVLSCCWCRCGRWWPGGQTACPSHAGASGANLRSQQMSTWESSLVTYRGFQRVRSVAGLFFLSCSCNWTNVDETNSIYVLPARLMMEFDFREKVKEESWLWNERR